MAQYWVRGYSTGIFSWPSKAHPMHNSNDVAKVGENNPHVLVVLSKHGRGLKLILAPLDIYQLHGASKWLLHSWLQHKQKREFSDTNFEIGKTLSSFSFKQEASLMKHAWHVMKTKRHS